MAGIKGPDNMADRCKTGQAAPVLACPAATIRHETTGNGRAQRKVTFRQ